MPLFDTHCHLDFDHFSTGRSALLEQAAQEGLQHLLIPGVVARDWPLLLQLLREPSPVRLWGALGLHPCFAEQHQSTDLDLLEQQLGEQHEQIIALGEVGLDAWPGVGHWQVQEQLFDAQLRLAQQFDLPLLLHVRKAHDQVLCRLRKTHKRWPKLRGIVHGFSGSLQQGQQYLELGFKLGVGGAFTHPGAKKLRQTLTALPASALVLETDAPDMAPVWGVRGANTPLNLPRIAAELAAVRGEPEAQLCAQLFSNSCGLFSLSTNAA